MAVTISFKPVAENLWMITYDNRILGDDRKYGSRDEARTEALRRCEEKNRDCIGLNNAVYYPGY